MCLSYSLQDLAEGVIVEGLHQIPIFITHAVTSVGGTTYTYDNNGNVTAIGSLDYTWDWRNRLATAERSGGGTTSYGYDHTGQRVFQVTGSATTSYPNRYYNVASSSLMRRPPNTSSRRTGRSWRR